MAWTYKDFNVYGQPETITAPDGKVTCMEYFGVRAERLTVSVLTPDGPQNRGITTVRDALKRTVSVNVQGAHDTTYDYDPNGKMVSASGCNSGYGKSSVASAVAKKLGVPVTGSSGPTWFDNVEGREGRKPVHQIPQGGRWVTFKEKK